MVIVDMLKVLYCTPFLIYSCYTDILTRKVSNQVWKVMLAGGAMFVLYGIIDGGVPALTRLLLSTGIIYAFVYVLFKLGGFGGADAKALIVLAILFPYYPQMTVMGVDFPLNGLPLIDLFSFSVLGNAILLNMVIFLGFLSYNVLTLKPGEILERPAYVILGYKTDISKLPGKFIKLIEEHNLEEGELRTRFRYHGVDINDDMVAELEKFAADGLIDRKVWVTPGLPFMIPITAGFFVAVFYGDLVFLLTKLLLISG